MKLIMNGVINKFQSKEQLGEEKKTQYFNNYQVTVFEEHVKCMMAPVETIGSMVRLTVFP